MDDQLDGRARRVAIAGALLATAAFVFALVVVLAAPQAGD
jgi:hypothetical protein